MVEELSQQDLKQVFATWLTAQASITADSDQHSGDDHVPVQQGTVVQLNAAEGSDSSLQTTAFQIQMKQPMSLLQKPAANYALLSAADVDMVAGAKAAPALQDAVQLPAEQLAMLGSSAAMHAAAHTALQHLLPMLAFPCR